MGTLYTELQKWLKSPVKPSRGKVVATPNSYQPQPKVKEVGKKELKNAPSVNGFTLKECVSYKNCHPSWTDNNGRFIPWLHSDEGKRAPYLTGQYAIDVATLANLPVQSLAYKTGHSPLLLPWALRYSPEQAYLDLGKLDPWDRWRVLWAQVGAHFFQDSEPFNAHEENWLR